MKAIKITTENEVSIVNVERPFYQTLEPIVGGFEIVRPKGLPRPYVMIVDDEGLLKDKPFNLVGSYLYETQKHGSPIVGDIVIMCEERGLDGYDLVGLSDQDIEIFLPFFHKIVSEYRLLLYEDLKYHKDSAQSEGGNEDAAQDLPDL